MKKILSFLIIFCSFYTNAQILLTEDANSLTVGNVGTDFSATNPGQGGWFTRTLVSSNGNNNNFQIVDSNSSYGNVIKINGYSGPAVAVGSPSNSRFMFKNIATAWANRDFGNEITQVEYDFYTGPATTSGNTMRVVLYNDAALTKMLAGFMIAMNPFSIRALAWYDPTTEPGGTGAIGNYSLPLGTNGANPAVFSQITLIENTWYHIGFSYNTTNGQLIFKGAGITRTVIQGAAAGTNVDNIQIIGSTGGTATVPNATSSTGTFDNIVVTATNTDTLLSINELNIQESSFTIAPNPANKFIKISNIENINISEISIIDFNGRVVINQKINGNSNLEINISELASGIYLLNINSNKGIITKKIIKE